MQISSCSYSQKLGGCRTILQLGDNGPLREDALQEIGRVDVLMMPIDIDSQFHILKAGAKTLFPPGMIREDGKAVSGVLARA